MSMRLLALAIAFSLTEQASISPDDQCISWRQTGGCKPDGKREKTGDKTCTAQIPSDASGYCECAKGKARPVSCGHEVFTCQDMCATRQRFQCVGWRQTGDCSPDGPREEANDQNCTVLIPPGSSGYCECGMNRTIRKTGCRTDNDQEAFTCQQQCEQDVSLYEVLGLDEFATVTDVKKSFRKASLKFHPDKIGADEAAKKKFNELRHAYDVLADAESRHLYDMGGHVALAKKGTMEKAGSREAWLDIPLAAVYNGETFMRSVGRRIICKNCKRGTAASNSPRCSLCNVQCPNELQIVNQNLGGMIFQQRQEVASQERCKDVSTALEVVIERGMAEGTDIKFELMGEMRSNMIPGDLTLKIRTEKHPLFRRNGHDLHMDLTISLKEALLGFRKSITHLDGREVWLESETISHTGKVLRLPEEGMPKHEDPSAKGELLCTITVDMPKKLNQEQKAWIEQNL